MTRGALHHSLDEPHTRSLHRTEAAQLPSGARAALTHAERRLCARCASCELKPTLLHVIGHGGVGAGAEASPRSREIDVGVTSSRGHPHGLYLHGAAGGAQLVSPGAIAQTLGAAGPSVRSWCSMHASPRRSPISGDQDA